MAYEIWKASRHVQRMYSDYARAHRMQEFSRRMRAKRSPWRFYVDPYVAGSRP